MENFLLTPHDIVYFFKLNLDIINSVSFCEYYKRKFYVKYILSVRYASSKTTAS